MAYINYYKTKTFLQNMADIRSKEEFYRKYHQGLFGNRPLTWETYGELAASGYRGDICIRAQNRKDFKSNIPFTDVKSKIKNHSPEELRFNQSMPDPHLVIQGEVMELLGIWNLTYTTVKKPMIPALREETRTTLGLSAKIILQDAMDPSSYEDLKALFDLYDGAVVEFSTYDIAVGRIPGRNTVFWEVRNY